MSRDLFFLLANGLSFAAPLSMLASGFMLIFGLQRIVSLAHGGFWLIGGYVALLTVRTTGSFWLAVLVAPVADPLGRAEVRARPAAFATASKCSASAARSSGRDRPTSSTPTRTSSAST